MRDEGVTVLKHADQARVDALLEEARWISWSPYKEAVDDLRDWWLRYGYLTEKQHNYLSSMVDRFASQIMRRREGCLRGARARSTPVKGPAIW